MFFCFFFFKKKNVSFLFFCSLFFCFCVFSLSTTLFQKNGNLSSLFSRRKIFVCQFPLWEAFSKNGSFLNVFETLYFESPLCFSLCAEKNLDIIIFSLSPSPSIKSHFSFSVLSFSLFLDVPFNYPCLQEKTKKCFLCPFHKLKLFVE